MPIDRCLDELNALGVNSTHYPPHWKGPGTWQFFQPTLHVRAFGNAESIRVTVKVELVELVNTRHPMLREDHVHVLLKRLRVLAPDLHDFTPGTFSRIPADNDKIQRSEYEADWRHLETCKGPEVVKAFGGHRFHAHQVRQIYAVARCLVLLNELDVKVPLEE